MITSSHAGRRVRRQVLRRGTGDGMFDGALDVGRGGEFIENDDPTAASVSWVA
jgi:hypothetical protein